MLQRSKLSERLPLAVACSILALPLVNLHAAAFLSAVRQSSGGCLHQLLAAFVRACAPELSGGQLPAAGVHVWLPQH